MSVRWSVAAVLLAAIITIALVFAFVQPSTAVERIADGVSAGGVDVSGLTLAEAATKLRGTQATRVARDSVTVRAADLTWRLEASSASVRLLVPRTARRALLAGRRAAGRPVDVALAVTYSKDAVNDFTKRIDRRLRRKPRDARLKISLTSVDVVRHKSGRDVSQVPLRREIGKALKDPRLPRVLEPELLRPKPEVTTGKLRDKADTVITIEQSTFTLRLLKDGEVASTYKVAVGQAAYPTPSGQYAIGSKQVDPVWSVPNSPWAGELAGTTVAGGTGANPLKARWMGIVNGVGIHGTDASGSIGTRASHGCIRMNVPDVVDLFEQVPVGTPVLIV